MAASAGAGFRISILLSGLHFVCFLIYWSSQWTAGPVQLATAEPTGSPVSSVSSAPSAFLAMVEALPIKSDKFEFHAYQRLYAKYFDRLQHAPIRLLEIGLGCEMVYGAGESLRLWLDFFPKADIHSGEFDGKCVQKFRAGAPWASRATFHTGNAEDKDDLKRWVVDESGGKGFDVVIDDASHQNHGLLQTFTFMWPYVAPGGLYFMEDLFLGSKSPGPMMIDVINDWTNQLVLTSRHDGGASKKFTMPPSISSIECISEMCVIIKCTNDPRLGCGAKTHEDNDVITTAFKKKHNLVGNCKLGDGYEKENGLQGNLRGRCGPKPPGHVA